MTASAAAPEFTLFIPQIRMGTDVLEARARAAEEAGFDGVALMDHLLPPGLPEGESYEGFVIATLLAARTESVRISHLVLCSEFRHPALLAKMATTLDHVSDGRFDLGIGWGSWPAEFPQFGLRDDPSPVRAARLGEMLDVITMLWSGESFDHDGPHYTLRGAMQRPTPLNGSIPIVIGGSGPKLTLPLVRRYADWWNCPSYGVDRLDELLPQVGDVRVSTQHPIGLAASSAERDDVVALAERRFGNWGGLLTGTPDEIVEALVREARLGVERFYLPFTDFAPPETIELFASEVIPAVRSELG